MEPPIAFDMLAAPFNAKPPPPLADNVDMRPELGDANIVDWPAEGVNGPLPIADPLTNGGLFGKV